MIEIVRTSQFIYRANTFPDPRIRVSYFALLFTSPPIFDRVDDFLPFLEITREYVRVVTKLFFFVKSYNEEERDKLMLHKNLAPP